MGLNSKPGQIMVLNLRALSGSWNEERCDKIKYLCVIVRKRKMSVEVTGDVHSDPI